MSRGPVTITLTGREALLLLANEWNDHPSWAAIGDKIRSSRRPPTHVWVVDDCDGDVIVFASEADAEAYAKATNETAREVPIMGSLGARELIREHQCIRALCVECLDEGGHDTSCEDGCNLPLSHAGTCDEGPKGPRNCADCGGSGFLKWAGVPDDDEDADNEGDNS